MATSPNIREPRRLRRKETCVRRSRAAKTGRLVNGYSRTAILAAPTSSTLRVSNYRS
jgi:hypothetical protein